MQVTVETLEKGFLINVFSEKNCPNLLVHVLQAFEQLNLTLVEARASCTANFQLEAISVEVRHPAFLCLIIFISLPYRRSYNLSILQRISYSWVVFVISTQSINPFNTSKKYDVRTLEIREKTIKGNSKNTASYFLRSLDSYSYLILVFGCEYLRPKWAFRPEI